MKKIISIIILIFLISACSTTQQVEQVSASNPTSTATKPPTATQTPTATRTARPTSTITPTPTPTEPLPSRVFLSPMNHQWQTQNNCEFASIAIVLAYYDIWVTQHEVKGCVHTLAYSIAEFGLKGQIFRVSSHNPVTMNFVIRWLLSQEIPVIVGGVVSSSDSTRHYRVVQGYDDESQIFFINDSLLGEFVMDYEEFAIVHKPSRSVVGDIIPVYPISMDEMILEQMRSWGMYPINN